MIDGSNTNTQGCILGGSFDYNSTDIELHVQSMSQSIFCSVPLIYGIRVKGNSNNDTQYYNITSTTNALLVASTNGTTMTSITIEKLRLNISNGGILIGESKGHANMYNVTIDADLNCTNGIQYCGVLAGTIGADSTMNGVKYTGIVTSERYVAGLMGNT